jgi:hypothetical protein
MAKPKHAVALDLLKKRNGEPSEVTLASGRRGCPETAWPVANKHLWEARGLRNLRHLVMPYVWHCTDFLFGEDSGACRGNSVRMPDRGHGFIG